MEDFDIGSRHTIWVNPFCDDVDAEVVSFTAEGTAIMRTLDEESLTLEPHEYVFPIPDQVVALEKTEQVFMEVYGEDL